MIEKRASLLSRVIPDSEKIYNDAIKEALNITIERLSNLQVGYTADSPDNTWTKKRLDFIINELSKKLGISSAAFQKQFEKDLLKIIKIDNTQAIEDYNAIVNIGHESDEVTPYYFKPLSKTILTQLFKTDYITFTRLNANGEKAYSSISLQTLVDSTALRTLEEVRSIIVANAILGKSPAAIVGQLKPLNKKAATNLRTVVRTMLADASNLADLKTLEDNRNYFDKYMFIATLDTRTTQICRSLDGKRWEEVPEMYKPPLHPNCRSKVMPTAFDQDSGTRIVVLPNGDIKYIDGNLSFKEAVKIYPALENRSFIDIDKYERLMLQS